jgi:hypothetical protein
VTRSAESYENEIRYWKQMAMRLNQTVQALNNVPETHTDRGLHRDPTGNRASSNIDRQRKKRK